MSFGLKRRDVRVAFAADYAFTFHFLIDWAVDASDFLFLNLILISHVVYFLCDNRILSSGLAFKKLDDSIKTLTSNKSLLFFPQMESAPTVTIYHNAKVYTCNPGWDIVSAFAVKNGRIVAVGTKETILAQFAAAEPILVDLQKRFVFPGFIDAHCHLKSFAQELVYVDLSHATSYENVIELLKDYYEKTSPKPRLVVGKSWNHDLWAVREFPHRRPLDKVFPDVPVVLLRKDYHAILVNGHMLRLAGISKKVEVDGGEVVTYPDGELTGLFIDNATKLVEPRIPAMDKATLDGLMERADVLCRATGLTAVGEAGLEKEDIEMIDELHKQARMKLRVNAMISNSKTAVEAYMLKGGYHTERLKVDSIKMYADGALGSRGAKMTEPYADMPSTSGLFLTTQADFESACDLAMKHKFQVCTHAIGDAANHLVLTSYAKFLKGKNDLRWRVEHAQTVLPEDIRYFADYSIIPSLQPTHGTSDCKWALDRLGKCRIHNAYRLRSLLEQNGWFVFGSDFPVEDINPLFGFYAAVVRRDFDGYPKEGFQMEEALTRAEVLKGMTLWAAKGMLMEKEIGSIETGKRADFVVLNGDLMECDMEGIRTRAIRVLQTYIQGECVFFYSGK